MEIKKLHHILTAFLFCQGLDNTIAFFVSPGLRHCRKQLSRPWTASGTAVQIESITSGSRLAASENLSFSSSEESSATEEDLVRWEKMYEGGSSSRAEGEIETAWALQCMASEVRVVSFDLDNTLWKTYGCINRANDELAEYLSTHKIEQPRRVENVMGDLFKANPISYCPLLEEDEEPKGPTLLTKLRTDALAFVLTEYNGYTAEEAKEFAASAFEVWTTARHEAIPENLADNVLDSLERISTIKSAQEEPVLIGAITDGNSDPRRVEELKKYFDFVVNAESVGVSKPDKRIYQEAVNYVRSLTGFKELPWVEEDGQFEAGPFWVHIGDDFVKDIVAGKGMNMRTIWAQELVKDKLSKAKRQESEGDKNKERDVKDFVKEVANQQVVKMPIGADSYLVDTFQDEFVDATVDTFGGLVDVLLNWNEEGISLPRTVQELQSSRASSKMEEGSSSTTQEQASQPDEFLSVVMPSPPASSGESGDVMSRAFRIEREEFSTDVLAPLQSRETSTMQDIMGLAQLDKGSGVFAFSEDEVKDLRVGKKTLQISIRGTDLHFSREVFVRMSVADVLSLTSENPLRISLAMKSAADKPSFDLF